MALISDTGQASVHGPNARQDLTPGRVDLCFPMSDESGSFSQLPMLLEGERGKRLGSFNYLQKGFERFAVWFTLPC
jgi:hypothetical protein